MGVSPSKSAQNQSDRASLRSLKSMTSLGKNCIVNCGFMGGMNSGSQGFFLRLSRLSGQTPPQSEADSYAHEKQYLQMNTDPWWTSQVVGGCGVDVCMNHTPYGGEDYVPMIACSYASHDAFLFVFDVTDEKSLLALNFYFELKQRYCANVPLVVVGLSVQNNAQNASSEQHGRERKGVSHEEGLAFARKTRAFDYIELVETLDDHDNSGSNGSATRSRGHLLQLVLQVALNSVFTKRLMVHRRQAVFVKFFTKAHKAMVETRYFSSDVVKIIEDYLRSYTLLRFESTFSPLSLYSMQHSMVCGAVHAEAKTPGEAETCTEAGDFEQARAYVENGRRQPSGRLNAITDIISRRTRDRAEYQRESGARVQMLIMNERVERMNRNQQLLVSTLPSVSGF